VAERKHERLGELYPELINAFKKLSYKYGVLIIDSLKWNEEKKSYDFGEMNWDEFWQVVKGHGPCNKERISARVNAWEKGKWVRDAAMAYAEKQANKEVKQAI
jgi:ring-1,2-phenylacetyl-CoA epoxidase subunit PaaA